ncbi:MAG: hypothetical protein GY815_11925 [Gammaproteobacteria bacterium]|nr:hypothetical protein [Gammaproteobacteria bacterium]
MSNVYVTRLARIPDPVRVDRYRRAPELGPQILFFSGGTAINTLSRLLNFVLIDSKNGVYPSRLSEGTMKELGVQVVDTPMVSKQSAPYYDAALLANALLSLT